MMQKRIQGFHIFVLMHFGCTDAQSEKTFNNIQESDAGLINPNYQGCSRAWFWSP